MPLAPRISVIVPALNEAAELPEMLRRLRAVPEVCEILVADGGSSDGTAALATAAGCRVIACPRGRGIQLRTAALQAQGEIVWMVHADTWVPEAAGRQIDAALQTPTVVGGAFWKQFRDPHWLMRGSRGRCWTRLHWFGRLAADQAIFVRRSALDQIGGIPPLPLMEEFELCRRLRALGRLVLAEGTVLTSARRWHERGVLKTYWLMWRITTAYTFGESPENLARRYQKGR